MNKIGCNTINIDPDCRMGVYSSETYERILKNYSRYTDWIKALEFSHVDRITPEEGKVIGELARRIGFDTWSIHSEHLNEGDTLEGYLKVQKHEAEVCAALGCQVMVCHLPNLVPYVEFERDLDIIGKVAELTHANGIKLAVETCGYPDGEHAFLSDAKLVIRIVETLDLPDVGINLDTGHCLIGQSEKNPEILQKILSGEIEQQLPALVKRIGKKLFTTHLQDNFGLNDDHQAPGFGYIDWEKLIPAILETGYQGPLMMELTGASVKVHRTVPQLRNYPLDKEVIFSASYLNFLLKQNEYKTITTWGVKK